MIGAADAPWRSPRPLRSRPGWRSGSRPRSRRRRAGRAARRSRASRRRRARCRATARRRAGWCRRSSRGRSWLALSRGISGLRCCGRSGQRKTSPAVRHEEASASTGGCPQLRKEEALGAQFLRHETNHVARPGAAVSTRLPRCADGRPRGFAPCGRVVRACSSGSAILAGAGYAVWRALCDAARAPPASRGSRSRSRSRRSRASTRRRDRRGSSAADDRARAPPTTR